MRFQRFYASLCGLLCPVAFGACSRAEAVAPSTGFAVVELFTSEGCSSCPRADDVLNGLAEEASRARLPVYTLAFHVDYWDVLGWRDPFSASWATHYQRAYAAALRSRGLYTPQMVVNGRDEFIGSHASQARASIAEARAKPRSSQLRLSARRDPERVVVHYDLSGAPAAGSLLRVALVDPESTSDVRAGENAGRKLRHLHVVRGFASAPLARAGDVSVAWPADFSAAQREQAFVVAYVQDRLTMEITAAARTDLRDQASGFGLPVERLRHERGVAGPKPAVRAQSRAGCHGRAEEMCAVIDAPGGVDHSG